MSQGIKTDVCWLLQVKQVCTSVYHPQTDGLVERFNQTLKRILWHVMDEDSKNWDLFLPSVLFVVCETPQTSMGFMPFKVLFGRRP